LTGSQTLHGLVGRRFDRAKQMADPLTIVGATAPPARLLEQAFKITQLIYGVYSDIREAPVFVVDRVQHIEQLIGIVMVIQQSPALQNGEVAGVLKTCQNKPA
jgi:hypothetical protein